MNAAVNSSDTAIQPPRLGSARAASEYQRRWFEDLRARCAAGEPLAIVGVDAPFELLTAMGIPFVVNQWWAALCAARQTAPRYLGLLAERGYREDLCRYCSLSFASAIDPDPSQGPWGGLPKPTLAIAKRRCDSQAKVFELWERERDAPLFMLDDTVATQTPEHWWTRAENDWHELVEPHRRDFLRAELLALVAFLEERTGRKLDMDRLRLVNDRANEQCSLFREARSLIAATVPSPVTFSELTPSVAIPLWHLGTEWGLAAARSFRDEIAMRVKNRTAAFPGERLRLMWIGPALWFDLGFYGRLQDRYGAVCVWSLYLAEASDMYIRRGGDPLDAVASRYGLRGDMLHMPPWNSDWLAKEAALHQVDGVILLNATAKCAHYARGGYFIERALEGRDIPVLTVEADIVDPRNFDAPAFTAKIERFIEDRLGFPPVEGGTPSRRSVQ